MAAAVTAVQDDYETTELRGSDSTAHVDHIYTSTSIPAGDSHTEKLDKSDTKVKAWVIVVGELYYYLRCSVGRNHNLKLALIYFILRFRIMWLRLF